jgi:predicted nucleotidyltransferase
VDKTEVITKIRDRLDEIRRQFCVESLAIFGSVARDETERASDIDVLVRFDRPATFDLFMDLKFYLEELLGTGVDLVTDKALRPRIRKAIEGELINVAR